MSKESAILSFAAEELQRYIYKMTDFKVPISQNAPGQQTNIILNLLTGGKKMPEDGFSVQSLKKDILLTSNSDRGILYAVYSFLEYLGCRWFYPTQTEEIVPKRDSLTTGKLHWQEEPKLKYRGIVLEPMILKDIDLILAHIDWMAKNRFNVISTHPGKYGTDLWSTDILRWEDVQDAVLPQLKKRGIMLNMHSHNLFYFLPPEKYYVKHPDWYAVKGGKESWGYRLPSYLKKKVGAKTKNLLLSLGNLIRYFQDPGEIIFPYEVAYPEKVWPEWLTVNGGLKIPSQICYTNKEALKEYTRNVLRYIKEHPEVDILGLWPADGGQFCKCNNCEKDPEKIIRLTVAIAKLAEKIRPGLLIEYIRYTGPTRIIPKITKGNKNILILVTGRDPQGKDWLEWSKENGCYGVYRLEYDWADNYAKKGNVRLNPDDVANWTRHVSEEGMLGMDILYIETHSWWRNAFNLYIFSKIAWKNNAGNLDEILKDYFSKYYRGAASEVARIFELLRHNINYSDSPGLNPFIIKSNQVAFTRIETIMKRLKMVRQDNLAKRIEKLEAYTQFIGKWSEVQNHRFMADSAFKKSDYQEAVENLHQAARLETRMQQMCQDSYYKTDGVLDMRLFLCLRRERFYENRNLLLKIQKEILKAEIG
ncbi:MAG: DUF4838 domain-containing protein [Candidatus Zixiibacteriota bacterium]